MANKRVAITVEGETRFTSEEAEAVKRSDLEQSRALQHQIVRCGPANV